MAETDDIEEIYYTVNDIDDIIQDFKLKFNVNDNDNVNVNDNVNICIIRSLEKLKNNIRCNSSFKLNNDPDYGIKSWIDALYNVNKAIYDITISNINLDIIDKRIEIAISKIVSMNDNDENYNEDNISKMINNNLINLYKTRDNLRKIKIKKIENSYLCNEAGYKCVYEWRDDCIQFLLDAINK
jgi:hypothetical protein